jgi:hypothetical protein
MDANEVGRIGVAWFVRGKAMLPGKSVGSRNIARVLSIW